MKNIANQLVQITERAAIIASSKQGLGNANSLKMFALL